MPKGVVWGGEHTEGSSAVAPQQNRAWPPSQGGQREPSRKNQPELPKRHTRFNHSGQAGQGRSQARGGCVAPGFTALGRVLLPAPSHLAMTLSAMSEHQRPPPGPPLPWSRHQHQRVEAISLWKEVQAAWDKERRPETARLPHPGRGRKDRRPDVPCLALVSPGACLGIMAQRRLPRG